MPPTHIVSWNVNSLRQRLPRVLAWLERHQPDVLCLQETKVNDEQFPRAEFEQLGYHVAFAGEQRGLNGVAIIAKAEPEDVLTSLPGDDADVQRRFLSARIDGVRVIDVYVPNGQQLGTDAFFYKVNWLTRLQRHLRESHDPSEPLVLLGDFNIAPADLDVSHPEDWFNQIHCSPIERKILGLLAGWGLEDALRRLHPETSGLFTWFDYRDTFKEFSPDRGLRIDLIYLTAPMAERLTAVEIDLEERAGENPSDHAPLAARFEAPG